MHPNAQMLREANAALRAGNFEKVAEFMTDGFVTHVPGSNLASGRFEGKDGFFRHFGTLLELTGGRLEIEVDDILGSDTHAVGIYRVRAERGDEPFEWTQVNVYRIADGKVSELRISVHEFEDWNAYWS